MLPPKKEKTEDTIPEVSPSELKVLRFLADGENAKAEIAETEIVRSGIDEREVSSAVSWLEKKNLISVRKQENVSFELSPEGRRFLSEGLPEKKAYKLIVKSGSASVKDIMSGLGPKDGKIALAQLAKLGMKPSGGVIKSEGAKDVEEIFRSRMDFLANLESVESPDPDLLDHFKRREDIVLEKKKYSRHVRINHSGIAASKLEDSGDSIAELTGEMLQSGSWRGRNFRKYDLNAPVERIHSASLHPLTYLIDKVRHIFLEMGFTEMTGHYVEYAGWNMDSLYIPQDHPAREMQDTFYLDTDKKLPFEDEEVLKIFKKTHEKGIPEYSGWGYNWEESKAREPLLRTHTTVSTIRYLYHHKQSPQAAFSVEKVFRHESVDWKHLAELYQIEGTYYGKDANLSTLLWLMKEFYSKLGFRDLKFVPSYYPYTEPSLDVVVKINGKEMELGGSGVFRPEVTRPLGLEEPVVAWGLGLERLAMIYYGFEDIREIYQTDLDWLRNFTLKY